MPYTLAASALAAIVGLSLIVAGCTLPGACALLVGMGALAIAASHQVRR